MAGHSRPGVVAPYPQSVPAFLIWFTVQWTAETKRQRQGSLFSESTGTPKSGTSRSSPEGETFILGTEAECSRVVAMAAAAFCGWTGGGRGRAGRGICGRRGVSTRGGPAAHPPPPPHLLSLPPIQIGTIGTRFLSGSGAVGRRRSVFSSLLVRAALQSRAAGGGRQAMANSKPSAPAPCSRLVGGRRSNPSCRGRLQQRPQRRQEWHRWAPSAFYAPARSLMPLPLRDAWRHEKVLSAEPGAKFGTLDR